MNVSVLVPAAGASSRFGGGTRKPFRHLAGEPLLARVCRALAALEGVAEVVVATHGEDLDRLREDEALLAAGMTLAVAGGPCRAASVWEALQASDPSADWVAVHDGARPFVSDALWERLCVAAQRDDAIIPALPVADTLKRCEGDTVGETVSRAGLYRVQTPQLFRRDLLLEAYEYALATGGLSERIPDDARLVEDLGRTVKFVLGDPLNLKITYPADLALAEAWCRPAAPASINAGAP